MGLNIRIESPIIPILLGEVKRALAVSRMLFEKGLLVPAIRPPTVPEGTSRLRISLMVGHEQGHLDELLGALEELRQS